MIGTSRLGRGIQRILRMTYRIEEVTAQEGTGHLIVSVVCWGTQAIYEAAEPLARRHDFILQVPATEFRQKRDANGWYVTTGGQSVDPATITSANRDSFTWDTETVNVDVRALVKAAVTAWWTRAEARADPTDTRDLGLVRLTTDPQGLLQRADVTALPAMVLVR